MFEDLTAYNAYGVYCVPRAAQHRPAARAVLAACVWEPETVELLASTTSGGDLVHAGAFFGDFIPALARSRENGAIVWAFEPNPESHHCAQLTVSMNELDNVVISQVGLDAEPGEGTLATSDGRGLPLGGGSRIIDPESAGSWATSTQVELATLDEVIGDHRKVAAIHLDIEGREPQALIGAMETIERSRPLLVLETVPNSEWIAQFLAPLGYEWAGSVHGNTILRRPS